MSIRPFVLNVTAPQTGIPTWAQGTRNAWVTLPGDTRLTQAMTANPGGTLAFIASYSGAALHPTTSVLYVIGGGHADYAGNDVYSLSLLTETPSWTQLEPPTPTALLGSTASDVGVPYCLDGKPASRHTYYSLVVVPSRNRVMMFGAGAVWGNGNGGFPKVDGFRLDTFNYDPAGTFADFPITQYGNMVVRDQNEDVWAISPTGGSAVRKWTAATGAWSSVGTTLQHTVGSIGAFDSNRNRVVRFPNSYSGSFAGEWWSVSDPTNHVAIPIGSPPGGWDGSYSFDPHGDRFLYVPRGSNAVYSIHPTTYTQSLITTTGTPFTVPSTDGESTYYGRMVYSPQLRGLVAMSAANQNVKFLGLN